MENKNQKINEKDNERIAQLCATMKPDDLMNMLCFAEGLKLGMAQAEKSA